MSNTTANSLNQLQSWLLNSIQRPTTSQSLLKNDAFNHLIDNPLSHKCGRRLTAERGLALYQNGYMLRLRECMRAEYPLLIQAFSQNWFDQMAQHYLASNPSRSTNLNQLSANFPMFLKRERPDHASNDKERAFDFMIALAEFERAKLEVSRAKGSEVDYMAESGDDSQSNLSLLDFHTFDATKLNLCVADNVRLLSLPLNLLEYLSNGLKITEELLQSSGQRLLLCRSNYQVVYFEITQWQYELIQSLRSLDRQDGAVSHSIDHVSNSNPEIAVQSLTPLFLAHLASKGALLTLDIRYSN